MVECGLVSVWKGVEGGGAQWKSGWDECGLFSIIIDMLQVCLVCWPLHQPSTCILCIICMYLYVYHVLFQILLQIHHVCMYIITDISCVHIVWSRCGLSKNTKQVSSVQLQYYVGLGLHLTCPL